MIAETLDFAVELKHRQRVMLALRRDVEGWLQSGAYLSGVPAISRHHPEATFLNFISICEHRQGGWTEEVLRGAWFSARGRRGL